MPNKTSLSTTQKIASPDYIGLVKFLLEPFLDNPDSLEIDCEQLTQKNKIWLRVAFDSTDKGKVFGRGGRNIQAIREILNTTATLAGTSIYLDIYNHNEDKSDNLPNDRRSSNGGGRKKTGRYRPRPSRKD
ncbi:MAG: KH domain-containing protein [Xenococcaceae cyanobacterium MO_188.B29]|nr:KH domain-containing protein [Xenococcaceae cyanobacterium MO_188.B29]